MKIAYLSVNQFEQVIDRIKHPLNYPVTWVSYLNSIIPCEGLGKGGTTVQYYLNQIKITYRKLDGSISDLILRIKKPVPNRMYQIEHYRNHRLLFTVKGMSLKTAVHLLRDGNRGCFSFEHYEIREMGG